MARYFQTYWVDQGVRCNALSPGGVENDQRVDFTNKIILRVSTGRIAAKDEWHFAI